MKILFVYPSINTPVRFHTGLGILSSILKKKGFNVSLFIITKKQDIKKLIKQVKVYSPNIIAFSCNSSYWNLVNSISRILKKRFDIPIFVGGVHPSIFPECLFDSYVDGICLGEGEHSFIELLTCLREKRDYTKTKGFWFKQNGKIIKNPLSKPVINLDELPFPDRTIFSNQIVKKYCNFLFSRGCFFNCSYCCNALIKRKYFKKQKYVRHRSVDNCIKEIQDTIKKYPPKLLIFDDDCINKDGKWFEEFCFKYKQKIGLPFICNTRVELFNEKTANLLKSINCKTISFGIESGDEELRKKILLRSISDESIIKAFQLAKTFGLKTHSFNMVGIPDETKEKFMKTVSLNRKINPDSMQISIFYPFPGTGLWEYCIKNDYIKGESYNLFDSPTIDYPNFSSKSIKWGADNFHFLVYRSNSLLRAYMEKLRRKLFMHDTLFLKITISILKPLYKLISTLK